MQNQTSLSDVLFTVVLVVALWAWNASAYVAIVSATVAYLGAAAIRSAANSETVRDVLQSRQAHVTERYRIRHTAPRALAADVPQIAYTPPVPQLPGRTFVAPVDLSVAKDAVLWALTLYGPDGKADPTRVNLKGGTEPPGRLKVAAPGNAAKEYLLTKRVIERIDHGYRLNIARYPDTETVTALLH